MTKVSEGLFGKRSLRFIAALLLLLALSAVEAAGEARTLALEECLLLAGEHHPSLEEARATLDAQRAKLDQVKAGTSLTGSLSASTTRNSRADQSYSTAFTVTKLLSDSGKNALERRSQGLAIDTASESQREAILTVRKGVKDAYYTLLLNGLKREQAANAVRTYERHLEKAKGFYEAGAKAKFDVTKAEVDLSNARIALVSAEASLATARAGLSNAVGIQLGDVEAVSPFLAPRALPDEPFAVEQAMANRPDIRTARLKSESGKLSVAIAAKGNAATVSLSGAANLSGSEWPLDDSFRATVTLSVPVFDGGLTDARVSEARYGAQGADAALRRVEQTVLYDVRSALLSVREAEARIPVAELLVRQAEENLTLAEGRYETGVGNVLEVADAVLAFNSAKVSHYQAQHDYSAALAKLEQSLGGEFE